MRKIQRPGQRKLCGHRRPPLSPIVLDHPLSSSAIPCHPPPSSTTPYHPLSRYKNMSQILGLVVLLNNGRPGNSRTMTDGILSSHPVIFSTCPTSRNERRGWTTFCLPVSSRAPGSPPCQALQGPRTAANTTFLKLAPYIRVKDCAPPATLCCLPSPLTLFRHLLSFSAVFPLSSTVLHRSPPFPTTPGHPIPSPTTICLRSWDLSFFLMTAVLEIKERGQTEPRGPFWGLGSHPARPYGLRKAENTAYMGCKIWVRSSSRVAPMSNKYSIRLTDLGCDQTAV